MKEFKNEPLAYFCPKCRKYTYVEASTVTYSGTQLKCALNEAPGGTLEVNIDEACDASEYQNESVWYAFRCGSCGSPVIDPITQNEVINFSDLELYMKDYGIDDVPVSLEDTFKDCVEQAEIRRQNYLPGDVLYLPEGAVGIVDKVSPRCGPLSYYVAGTRQTHDKLDEHACLDSAELLRDMLGQVTYEGLSDLHKSLLSETAFNLTLKGLKRMLMVD